MQAIRARAEAGEWGPLTRVRAMDKGDHRVGVEESMIHAPHVFDAMLYLAGEAPVQVSGLVLQNGRPATRADAVGRSENGAGPIAGDRISATYLFPSGVIGTFESVPVGDGSYGSDRLGADCYYQHALVTMRNEPRGQFHVLPRGDVFPTKGDLGWEEIDGSEGWAPDGDGTHDLEQPRARLRTGAADSRWAGSADDLQRSGRADWRGDAGGGVSVTSGGQAGCAAVGGPDEPLALGLIRIPETGSAPGLRTDP